MSGLQFRQNQRLSVAVNAHHQKLGFGYVLARVFSVEAGRVFRVAVRVVPDWNCCVSLDGAGHDCADRTGVYVLRTFSENAGATPLAHFELHVLHDQMSRFGALVDYPAGSLVPQRETANVQVEVDEVFHQIAFVSVHFRMPPSSPHTLHW